MVDGDAVGVTARKASLSAACEEQGVAPLTAGDNVLVCVPTWNIETWLAYLRGKTVDEAHKGYPRLPKPRQCTPMVNKLVKMCRADELRLPAPASLEDACRSYRSVFAK